MIMARGMDVGREELEWLVAGLRFTAERSDYRAGTSWAVYVHPWAGAEADCFDALVTIRARAARESSAWCVEGLRVSALRGGAEFLEQGRTNARGQVWLRGLPASGHGRAPFRARLLPRA